MTESLSNLHIGAEEEHGLIEEVRATLLRMQEDERRKGEGEEAVDNDILHVNPDEITPEEAELWNMAANATTAEEIEAAKAEMWAQQHKREVQEGPRTERRSIDEQNRDPHNALNAVVAKILQHKEFELMRSRT